MKIVLAEDRSGKLIGERTFTGDIILVGRDPSVCHYFFKQEEWPMVSRKHVEFRLKDGRWLVSDVNSRFGTFMQGKRLAAPVEVRVGSSVQLGTDGPILRVLSIEQAPQAKPQQPTELGSMETFRESVQAPSAPIAPAAAAVGLSPHKASAPPMARTGAGPAYLQLMDERMQPVTRIDL